MAVTRYEPWGVISQLQQDINRVFGNLNDAESSSATAQWSPAVDVREYGDRFQLLLDVPGVEPKDVEITLDNGVLTVSGARREEKAVETRGASRRNSNASSGPWDAFTGVSFCPIPWMRRM
jgi:HSP20 family protein